MTESVIANSGHVFLIIPTFYTIQSSHKPVMRMCCVTQRRWKLVPLCLSLWVFMGVYITRWKSETELKGAAQADVQNGTYFGGPWGPLMQFPTIYSGCHSLAGKFLRWGKCQCGPRVSECRCCGPESPWCWCARHPRTGHRPERGCSGCLRVQMWDQRDPDLE